MLKTTTLLVPDDGPGLLGLAPREGLFLLLLGPGLRQLDAERLALPHHVLARQPLDRRHDAVVAVLERV